MTKCVGVVWECPKNRLCAYVRRLGSAMAVKFLIQSWNNVVVSPVDGSGWCCSFCLVMAWNTEFMSSEDGSVDVNIKPSSWMVVNEEVGVVWECPKNRLRAYVRRLGSAMAVNFFIQSWNVVVSPVDGSGGCCSFCLVMAWKSMDR